MTYSLKFNKIMVWQDITSKEHNDFYNYLKEHGFICNHTDFQDHKMLDF